MSTVLFVHRDAALRAFARRALEAEGFRVAASGAVAAVCELAREEAAAFVLLPWTTSEAVRTLVAGLREQAETAHCRIVVLADRTRMGEAVRALDLGADECLGLPCEAAELVARVRACARRPPAAVRVERLSAGPLALDRAAHAFTIHGQEVRLAPTEFRLIAFLLEHPGRVFTRAELLRRAWPAHIEAGPRTVDVHVRRLRQLFEWHGCPDMIQTVRGFGYRLAPSPAPRAVTGRARLPGHASRVAGEGDGSAS
ncbi:MAG TPA: winged helix-turn-helix domain-containing protein [Gammaproteobacteria bacterium]